MPLPAQNNQNDENLPLPDKTKKIGEELVRQTQVYASSNNQQNLEKKSMPLPAKTQQKSDNPPLPAKKLSKGEGCMPTQKMYTTFIHKLFG